MELKYIVYITINLCNGKFYIGVHKTNPEVFDNYIGDGIYRQSQATKKVAFHNAVRKYGYENFKRTTLRIFDDTEEGRKAAFKLEAELVTSTLLKSKQSYNTAIGGFGSIGLEECKKVYMFDLSGNYLRSFKSSRDAARFLETDNEEATRQAIKNNCRGKTSSSNGYYWSYKKEFGYENNNSKPVAQYTLSGKFLKYFNSITEAEFELNLTSIQQAVVKGYQCGGFQWRYYDGDPSDIKPLINTFTKNSILPILKIDKLGNVEEFESVNKCVEVYPELSTSQINRVLKGIIKSHKGCTFKYKDKDIV